MPDFMLEPVREKLGHNDWAGSVHHLECIVVAEDESHARRLAAAAFRMPRRSPDLPDPWSQPELVTAWRLVRKSRSVPGLPLGTVLRIS
ncbi:hypothetical protein [Roseomonas xinghualingensis]|uniref:hypothetical protein n=1 Tax=Roseomonas xinghualingensis TaxID=2986475 RepID=UPI0021F1F9BC|nr:hypothetical protein [Roseomonas sp. SXEYE001]MCV4210390.1 hypothetical protein [Roseomonas sp. SXEYE001]